MKERELKFNQMNWWQQTVYPAKFLMSIMLIVFICLQLFSFQNAMGETRNGVNKLFLNKPEISELCKGSQLNKCVFIKATGKSKIPKEVIPLAQNIIKFKWQKCKLKGLRNGRFSGATFCKKQFIKYLVTEDSEFTESELMTTHFIVFGEGLKGWGEEGRVWWNLMQSNLPNTYIYGQHKFIQQSSINKNQNAHLKKENVLSALNKKEKVIILDVRSEKEFNGATPYFSKRGGHIPTAVHLYWKNLFDNQGIIKSEQEITHLLKTKGIEKNSKIILYCTGGVRSAWVVAVLKSIGIDNVYNYDGSWWEWSGDKNLPIEK